MADTQHNCAPSRMQCNTKSRHRRKRKGDGRRERGPFTCQRCGVEYLTRCRVGEGENYCSRDCSYAATSAGRQRPSSKIYISGCGVCGTTFVAPRLRANCSAACDKEFARRYTLARGKAKHRADKAMHEVACPVCRTLFCRVYGAKGKICSEACSAELKRIEKRKTGNHRRRARHYGVKCEPVDVLRVFGRDGWRCQMCGISTPKRLRGKRKHNSPELDHVIPISKGGEHTYTNTQCACRRCNIDKGSDTRPSQRPLFAA